MIYANPMLNLTTTEQTTALKAAHLPTEPSEWTADIMEQVVQVLDRAQARKVTKIVETN